VLNLVMFDTVAPVGFDWTGLVPPAASSRLNVTAFSSVSERSSDGRNLPTAGEFPHDRQDWYRSRSSPQCQGAPMLTRAEPFAPSDGPTEAIAHLWRPDGASLHPGPVSERRSKNSELVGGPPHATDWG
jgi:hypothetical protein